MAPFYNILAIHVADYGSFILTACKSIKEIKKCGRVGIKSESGIGGREFFSLFIKLEEEHQVNF